MNRWWIVALATVLVALVVGPPAGAAEKSGAGSSPVLTGPVSARMEEAPAKDLEKERMGGEIRRYSRGQIGRCSSAPSKDVKAYPTLKSKRPLYGSVTFDANPNDPKSGITFQFVLDESGEATKPAEDEKSTSEKKGAEKEGTLGGLKVSPAPAKAKYDRMYFDANGDLDLTNDGVLKVTEKQALDSPYPADAAVFEDLKVLFDFGPPAGKRPMVLVSRVAAGPPGSAMVEFKPKMARKGKIKLGDQQCVVWLSQSMMISGRFDRPLVQLDVVPADRESKAPLPLKSGFLGQMQVVDGKFWTVSASPLGDELTITPYRGDLGVLEIDSGGRTITDMGIVGRLVGPSVMVPLGESEPWTPEVLPRRYEVPVGDYMLPMLTAQYGRLRFNARMMPNLGPAAGKGARTPAYPVAIRKDKPFRLAFSGKPDVNFLSPNKTQAFKPGDRIHIAVMLTEAAPAVQITGLWDTTQKKGSATYRRGDKEVTVPEYVRLDPTIVIRDSKKEQVVEGKMPFG